MYLASRFVANGSPARLKPSPPSSDVKRCPEPTQAVAVVPSHGKQAWRRGTLDVHQAR